jgi:hypothetical protein
MNFSFSQTINNKTKKRKRKQKDENLNLKEIEDKKLDENLNLEEIDEKLENENESFESFDDDLLDMFFSSNELTIAKSNQTNAFIESQQYCSRMCNYLSIHDTDENFATMSLRQKAHRIKQAWIDTELFKEKPLFIYGPPGVGKSRLVSLLFSNVVDIIGDYYIEEESTQQCLNRLNVVYQEINHSSYMQGACVLLDPFEAIHESSKAKFGKYLFGNNFPVIIICEHENSLHCWQIAKKCYCVEVLSPSQNEIKSLLKSREIILKPSEAMLFNGDCRQFFIQSSNKFTFERGNNSQLTIKRSFERLKRAKNMEEISDIIQRSLQLNMQEEIFRMNMFSSLRDTVESFDTMALILENDSIFEIIYDYKNDSLAFDSNTRLVLSQCYFWILSKMTLPSYLKWPKKKFIAPVYKTQADVTLDGFCVGNRFGIKKPSLNLTLPQKSKKKARKKK